MTLEEQCRLSFYKEIAGLGTHENVKLVQHIETNKIYVKKVHRIYNKEVYDILMKMHDQHVPEILECIEDESQLIIIEEYIQGESLAEHIVNQGVYSEEEAIAIFITLCDVLNLFHHFQPPVISRDLKPENIIIANNGVLKLVDFNTAKRVVAGKDRDTVLIGTREYAAPEQYGFAQSDMRTDIYALGVMLNYMLTGKYPREMLYQPEENDSKTLGKKDQSAEKSQKLTAIIQKCTAFSPDMRYQNVMELKRALCFVRLDQEDLVDTEKKYFKEKNISSKKHLLLPPGFRSGHLWKMMVGVLGYFFIFWLCLTMEFTDTNQMAITGLPLWINRICVLIGMLFTVVMLFNYGNIQNYLPFPKNQKFRIPVSILWCIAGFLVMAAICAMLT